MIDKTFLELTKRWYKFANNDHHKDRDCHFKIVEKWSYGERPTYYVEHYGYLLHKLPEFSDEFKTKREAIEYISMKMVDYMDGMKGSGDFF